MLDINVINMENNCNNITPNNKLDMAAKAYSVSEILTGQPEQHIEALPVVSNMDFQPKTSNTDCNSKEKKIQHSRRSRRSRPRRRRKGKIHRAGLPDQNGNSWRYNIGAPRNDNEFLLNQSTTPADYHRESEPETPFPYATSDDELETCPICHGMEMKKDSGIDSDTETRSDYVSSPSHRHVCLPNEMCSLNIHSDQEFEDDVSTGPDMSFLERNFEAEYVDNLMMVLNESSKEELVARCRELMDKVKDLETNRANASPAK